MITQETINRGGSKLEITRAIIEQELDIPTPRSIWKYSSQNLATLKKDFEAMKKPVIVRGSHPNDYHGFIDIVPTRRDIKDWNKLEFAVAQIEWEIQQNPDVKVHCEDWHQPYTPEVHVLVQEQSPSKYLGSMIRHPHTRELHIEWEDITDRQLPKNCADTRGDNLKICDAFSDKEIGERDIKGLVEMYERLEKSGLLDTEWAYQVEFGFRPLLFFQARPFKKFRPAENFKVPFKFDSPNAIQNDICFGITPPEGIVLPFLDWDMFNCFSAHDKKPDTSEPYGLIQTGRHNGSPSTGMRLGNLAVFCSPQHEFGYLFHGNYRLLKQAEYSVIEPTLKLAYSTHLDVEKFSKARVISNGRSMSVLPEM